MIHDTIKQRLRASLLLTPPPKSAQALALRHAASLQADGTWNDLVPPNASLPGTGRPAHLERTLLLAKAHRAAAGVLDDPLRRALDLWLSHDFASPDWRENQIVIPRLVGEIALLYDHGLSPGAAGKVMEILARSRWADWVAPAGWVDRTGMDLLGVAYNHLLRGCLESAPSFFDAAFGRIFREIRPAQPGEAGIQADMTFHAPDHETAGTGFAFTRECAQFIALAHGTPWQAPADTVKLFAGLLLDSQQWMMRQGTVDLAAIGTVSTDTADLAAMAAVVQQLAQLGNPPRRLELAAFAQRMQGRGEALSGHRYFWRARMAVHQRPGFYASLRLTPPPIRGSTSAVSPWADGQTHLLRSGTEYQGLSVPANGELAPGTTTCAGLDGSARENVAPPGDDAARHLSGGVSEGDYGLTATELKRPGLAGKKAWFFFDESVVCLGTGLHGALTNRPVRTTINHCRLQGPVAVRSVTGERRMLPPETEHALTSISAVEHDGISYVFLTPANVFVHAGSREPAPSAGPADPATFRLQIDHGSPLPGGVYTYLVLPAGDDPETLTRVPDEVSRIEVLANSPALQAVRHGGLGLLGVAFWEPGVVPLPGGGRVAANHPCLLLCREIPGGGTRLSISNPSDTAAIVHVEYGGQCVSFQLAGGLDAGRSVSRLL